MKRSLKKKLIFIGGGLVLFIGGLFALFFDGLYDTNFRTMQDPISSTEKVDLRGLRELKASGGFSVNYANIKKRLTHIQGSKIIVDGMSAYHGYIHGIPTTALGYHISSATPGPKHLLRRLLITGAFKIRPDLVQDAREEAKKYGFEYKSFKIKSKSVPADAIVDDIVAFFDNVSPDTWLHFHCHHGTGRTSILLVMLDIMQNAPSVAVKDIVRRQHLLGSTDLFNTEKWKYGTYTKEQLEHRKKFIEDFYTFVCQRKEGGIQRWSDWRSHANNNRGID